MECSKGVRGSNWDVSKHNTLYTTTSSAMLGKCRPSGHTTRVYSHRPTLSCGNGEESEESPQHVVIVKIVLFPFTCLGFHLVSVVIQKLTPDKQRGKGTPAKMNLMKRTVVLVRRTCVSCEKQFDIYILKKPPK